ncbi:MAG: DNA gyrase subunit A [Polyangiales bacterium]
MQPRLLNLKQLPEHFIAHRREVVTRRTRYDLRKALEQLEIVEGLRHGHDGRRPRRLHDPQREGPGRGPRGAHEVAVKGLEAFVTRAGRPESEIKAAKARGDYFLSERQAKAILEMRLARLTGLAGAREARR